MRNFSLMLTLLVWTPTALHTLCILLKKFCFSFQPAGPWWAITSQVDQRPRRLDGVFWPVVQPQRAGIKTFAWGGDRGAEREREREQSAIWALLCDIGRLWRTPAAPTGAWTGQFYTRQQSFSKLSSLLTNQQPPRAGQEKTVRESAARTLQSFRIKGDN